jgi:hypothetical protein
VILFGASTQSRVEPNPSMPSVGLGSPGGREKLMGSVEVDRGS